MRISFVGLGNREKYALAWVNTTFLTTIIKSTDIPKPCADLIIGNVKGLNVTSA